MKPIDALVMRVRHRFSSPKYLKGCTKDSCRALAHSRARLFIYLSRGGAEVARQPHKLEVLGPIPSPASNKGDQSWNGSHFSSVWL